MGNLSDRALPQDDSSPSSSGTIPPEILTLPEKSRGEWVMALAIFLLSLLFLYLYRDTTVFDPDEGIVLQGAERVLRGEVLYRDFFSFLTPGSFYWMALLLKAFGNSILVARSALWVYGGIFSTLTYLLARRVSPRWAAGLASYLLLITCLPFRFIVVHNWDSSLWALLALYGAVCLLQTGRRAWALATGSFTSLAFLFEQSKGGGLLLGLFLGFALIARKRPAPGSWHDFHPGALAAGCAWPLLPVVGYWIWQRSLLQMLADWFWPLKHYSTANRVPYGTVILSYENWAAIFRNPSWPMRGISILVLSPCFIIFLLPAVALALMFVHARDLRRAKPFGEASKYFVLISATVVGLVLSALATGRADIAHIIFISPPLFVILAWLAEARSVRFQALATLRPLLASFLLVSFTLFGLMLLLGPLHADRRILTRRGGLIAAADNPAIEYLQQHVRPGEKVLIYPYQPLYYFLTATFSPTRFDFLQPGLNTSRQFQESIEEVSRDRTPFVLYDSGFIANFLPEKWPATPLSALATEPLRDLISSSYHPCAVLGAGRMRYVCMVRKDLACPSSSELSPKRPPVKPRAPVAQVKRAIRR